MYGGSMEESISIVDIALGLRWVLVCDSPNHNSQLTHRDFGQ